MPKHIRVCAGPHCSYRGSSRIMEVLEKYFGIKAGNVNEKTDLNFCACTNYCEQGPNVVVNNKRIYHESKTKDIVERIENTPGEVLVKIDEAKIDTIIDNLV